MTLIEEGIFNLILDNQAIYLENTKWPETYLQIVGKKGKVSEVPISSVTLSDHFVRRNCIAVLGIIELESELFIVIVKSAHFVGKHVGNNVFKTKDVQLVPLSQSVSTFDLSEELDYLIQGIRDTLQMGFYFCFSTDITSNLQRRSDYEHIRKPDFSHCNANFFWNNNLFTKFKKITSLNKFLVPVIHGHFVSTDDIKIGERKITIELISRKSAFHVGTRYLARGITEAGKVANCVETEMIVNIDDQVSSVTFLRGSAPVFFTQNTLGATTMTGNDEQSINAAILHSIDASESFGNIFMVNLLSGKRPEESVVTLEMEKILKLAEIATVRYRYWDMHEECSLSYVNLDVIIKGMSEVSNLFGYFKKGASRQNGLYRINCMDCLDRTNLFQARLSWFYLEKIVFH